MKKSAATIVGLVGAGLIFAFLAWAFSLHSTSGLYHVQGTFRPIVLVLLGFGLALLLLTLLRATLKSTGAGRRWLSVLVIVLSLPAIVVPTGAFVYLNGTFAGIGDSPPQLLIADGAGAYGIPDMAVAFNTAEASRNTLTWGEASAMNTVGEDKATKQHVFMLRDLKPDARYYYRINDGEDVPFATPLVNGQLRFAIGSDAHYGASDARHDLTAKMLSQIASPDNHFDMFFLLGDIVERGYIPSQWNEAFNGLSPTTAVIPTRFAAGNHDTLFTGIDNYKRYCYPEGMDVQTGSRLWYRLDVGQVHFLVIDLEWSAESYTSAQAEWLEAQLQSIPSDEWKVVMGHGFFYGSGSIEDGWKWYDNPETIERLTPLFEKYGVDLALSGHNHQLEILQNAGVTYVIGGALGGVPDEERSYESPSSVWYMGGQHGFMDLTLDGDDGTLVFRDPEFKALKTFEFSRNGK